MTDSLYITYTEADMDLIPKGITIPAALAEALAARDTAYDAYGDALIKYDDVLRQDYITAAQARDAANVRAAVLAGSDPDEIPSEVARVTAARGRAVGLVNGLADRVRQCDREIYRQWVAVLPQAESEVSEALGAAEDALRRAEDAFRAARSNHAAMVNTLVYVSLMKRGVVRSQTGAPKYMPGRDEDRIAHARLHMKNLGVGDPDASVEMRRVLDASGNAVTIPMRKD
ncbi:hypothetical protein [Streptomyces stelliscabiei]|uniref:Uncharacterized protein YukE n=1 Tax=Streptomyces stelliscabiei TaxID=146820 RepID=A0A8I0TPS5_9ACTN|nr:hypothetical protein [Streptomyces stelliscabiei]KND45317.1 hypothetical protein IQ64_07765 [Streptomyces stelliscabiei]MBE1597125.1 uncharacterized protein YukE [Streptomyces stelliscabiei]